MNTIYGWHLMSQYEREHFRYLLTLQNSPEDRENFLLLHKHKMQYRAAQLTHPEPKPSIQQNLRSVSLSGRIRR